MDALEVLDFDFANSQIISKVILKSDCMREAFSELDVTSDILEVAIVPPTLPQPRLRLTTYGFSGTTHYDFPRDSDPVEVFECSSTDPYVTRYRLSLLRPSTNRALALSSRVSLRMNDRGFLSLQYMINSGNSEVPASFVEFYVSCFFWSYNFKWRLLYFRKMLCSETIITAMDIKTHRKLPNLSNLLHIFKLGGPYISFCYRPLYFLLLHWICMLLLRHWSITAYWDKSNRCLQRNRSK